MATSVELTKDTWDHLLRARLPSSSPATARARRAHFGITLISTLSVRALAASLLPPHAQSSGGGCHLSLAGSHRSEARA